VKLQLQRNREFPRSQDHASESAKPMINMRLAKPLDFSALRKLREAIFRHELRIQQENYEDVFNDRHELPT
jgi:hypothetical protein